MLQFTAKQTKQTYHCTCRTVGNKGQMWKNPGNNGRIERSDRLYQTNLIYAGYFAWLMSLRNSNLMETFVSAQARWQKVAVRESMHRSVWLAVKVAVMVVGSRPPRETGVQSQQTLARTLSRGQVRRPNPTDLLLPPRTAGPQVTSTALFYITAML